MPQQDQKNKPSVQRGLNVGEDILSYLMLANQAKTVGDKAAGMMNRAGDAKAAASGGRKALAERRAAPQSKVKKVGKALTDVRPGLKNRVVMDLPTQLDYAHQVYQAFNPKEMGYGYQEGYETPDDPSDDYNGEAGRNYTYNQLLAVALKNGLNVGTDIGIDVLGALASKGKGVGPKSMSPTVKRNVAGMVGEAGPAGLQMYKDNLFQQNIEPYIEQQVQRHNIGGKAAKGASTFLKDFDLVFGTKAHPAVKSKVDETFDFMGGASKFESQFPISRARRGDNGELDPRYGDVGRILSMLSNPTEMSPQQTKFMSDLEAKYKAHDTKAAQPIRQAAAKARENTLSAKGSLLGSIVGKLVQHFGQ